MWGEPYTSITVDMAVDSRYVEDMGRKGVGRFLALAVSSALAVLASPAVTVAAPNAGDFNGDGFDDLAISARDDVDGKEKAGAVSVIYGGRGGLSGRGDQRWTQNSRGIPGRAEDEPSSTESGEDEDTIRGIGDGGFGSSMGIGDFDDDGYDDLAVGTPGEDGPHPPVYTYDHGSVTVIYGGRRGLTASGAKVFTLESPGVPGDSAEHTHFGSGLAGGDFDGDGKDDLAVGAPHCCAGMLTILFGSSHGLRGPGAQSFTAAEVFDGQSGFHYGFGEVLASGRFDRGRFDDLVVGTPAFEGLINGKGVGATSTLYGTPDGLELGLPTVFGSGASTNHPWLGSALTAADFAQNGRDDLVAGAPGEGEGGTLREFWGSSDALTLSQQDPLSANRFCPESPSATDNAFAASLATGDLVGDGRDDVVIGQPHDDFPGITDPGSACVAAGNDNGLQFSDMTFVAALPETGDELGSALAVGSFGRGRGDDLAISAPGEDGGVGLVYVFYHHPEFPSPDRFQVLGQGFEGIKGTAGSGERFGSSLAPGRDQIWLNDFRN